MTGVEGVMVMYMEKDETGERVARLSARIRKRVRRESFRMAGVAFGAVALMAAADVAIITVTMH